MDMFFFLVLVSYTGAYIGGQKVIEITLIWSIKIFQIIFAGEKRF